MANLTVPPQDFYVYVLFRETGLPFYVGKGKGQRWREHAHPSRIKSRSHKNNAVKTMIAKMGEVPIVKVAECLCEKDAFILESALIAALGRYPNGILLNKTDGGDGASGARRTPDQRERYRLGAHMRWARASADERIRIGEILHSPEALEKRAQSKRKPITLANRANASAAAKRRVNRMSPTEFTEFVGRLSTPAAVAKRKQTVTGRKRGKYSASHRQSIKAGLRRYHDRKNAAREKAVENTSAAPSEHARLSALLAAAPLQD